MNDDDMMNHLATQLQYIGKKSSTLINFIFILSKSYTFSFPNKFLKNISPNSDGFSSNCSHIQCATSGFQQCQWAQMHGGMWRRVLAEVRQNLHWISHFQSPKPDHGGKRQKGGQESVPLHNPRPMPRATRLPPASDQPAALLHSHGWGLSKERWPEFGVYLEILI